MTRIWQIIAVVATWAYLGQIPGCVENTGNGFNFIQNIPSSTNVLQWIQNALGM